MIRIRKIGYFAGAKMGMLLLAGICFYTLAVLPAGAQSPPTPGPSSNTSKVLAWDADLKEVTTKPGDAVAKFTFSVTNLTDGEVVITDAKPSCGCTEAKMPSKPWHLGPQSNGVIEVGVNLAGKSGTIFKWVDVFYASNATKRLNLKVTIAEDPKMVRDRNQAKAKGDRQAVFKGDCASCHAEKTKGKTGKDLYAAACGVCHDADPRATMVPDLHAINHSMDYNFWKVWISDGKAGTLMPAFSTKEGGPLTDEQIDSLAQFMVKTFPQNMRAAAVRAVALSPTTTSTAPANPSQKN